MEYLKVTYKFPGFINAASEARYMAARSSHLSGELDTAVMNYQKVIDDYPGTGWVERASNMLEEIKEKGK